MSAEDAGRKFASCTKCGFTVIGATPTDVREGMQAHICPDRYRLPWLPRRAS